MKAMPTQPHGRSTGVSLIELMVALAIGAILVLGLVQVFGASRAAYQMSEGIARVQENARFAMDYLQRDIRMAGHFGCVNDQAHFVKDEGDPTNHLTHADLDFSVSVQGYEAAGTGPQDTVTIGGATGGWTPTPPSFSPAPSPGSDIIVLRYLGSVGTPVTVIGGSPGAEELSFATGGWDALTDEGVTSPTLFGVADCSFVDVFQGSGGTSGVTVGGTPATQLASRYNAFPAGQAMLYRANAVAYYVAPGATGEPALWRARADDTGAFTSEELVEGIESLQLLYGQDATPDISAQSPPVGNIVVHQPANLLGTDATEWRRVGLVQVGMLVSSPDRASAPQAVDAAANPRVLGVEFEPATTNDAHYRVAYEATIAVRNRLFGN